LVWHKIIEAFLARRQLAWPKAWEAFRREDNPVARRRSMPDETYELWLVRRGYIVWESGNALEAAARFQDVKG